LNRHAGLMVADLIQAFIDARLPKS
jgi:hypothetical protein